MRVPAWFDQEHGRQEIESRASAVGYQRALKEIDLLSSQIATGCGERDVQRHLRAHPYLLLGRCRTGHGTYAFGEQQLGSEYRIDWAIANGNSGGLTWETIELESPKECPFKRDGHFSCAARKGIDQINNWRCWLGKNDNYAQRPKSEGGLGLHDIDASYGVVIVGRRIDYMSKSGHSHYNKMRRMLDSESRIRLISYETFIESLRFRFAA